MIVRTVSNESVLYQSTDLARRHRDVIGAARRSPHGTVIRDKDGTALLLTVLTDVQQTAYVSDGLRDAVSLLLSDTLQVPNSQKWLELLPIEDRQEFVREYVQALLVVNATGTEPVEQLLYEWRQSARVLADAALSEELTSDVRAPLTDVEL